MGQSTVEYALIVATVAILVLLTIGAFGSLIDAWLRVLLAHILGTTY